MRITLRGYYAVLALATIADENRHGGRLRIEDITRVHPIPEPFLLQILQDLKKSGLVRSKRGVRGGYQLAKSAESITLTQILESVEGPLLPSPFQDREGEPESKPAAWKALDELLGELRTQIRELGNKIRLSEISRRLTGEDTEMYYI